MWDNDWNWEKPPKAGLTMNWAVFCVLGCTSEWKAIAGVRGAVFQPAPRGLPKLPSVVVVIVSEVGMAHRVMYSPRWVEKNLGKVCDQLGSSNFSIWRWVRLNQPGIARIWLWRSLCSGNRFIYLYVDCSGRPEVPALFEVILYLISCLSSEGHFYVTFLLRSFLGRTSRPLFSPFTGTSQTKYHCRKCSHSIFCVIAFQKTIILNIFSILLAHSCSWSAKD